MKIRKNLLSALLIYVTLLCVEMLIVFLKNLINIDILKYDSEFWIIVVRLLCFVIVLLFGGFKNLKKGYLIPRVYWFSLFIIPIGTIILLFSLFIDGNHPIYLTAINIGIVLLINIIVFYLFDSISRLMTDSPKQHLMEQQNQYYENQLSLMKDTLTTTKVIRHDLKNRLIPIYDLALNSKNNELVEQLSELTNCFILENEYAFSGNSAIDSIINFKLQQAKKENIDVSCEIIIPSEISISPFDSSIILGNLIDNAIEGTKTINIGRWIDIKIKYTKGRLIINIGNSFDGIVYKNNGVFVSRKMNTKNHGLGLISVQTAIQKYNGIMDAYCKNNKFEVKVLMYI
jgi:signal transduction histidine kinase